MPLPPRIPEGPAGRRQLWVSPRPGPGAGGDGEQEQHLDDAADREEEVLLTVARGLTNAEISTQLHLSTSTVKFHLASLMTKLGARNRVQLAMWAYETQRVK